jgi:hypothetical protein
MKKMFIVAFVVAAAIGACGGKKKADTMTTDPGSAAGSDMGSAAGSDMGSAAGSNAPAGSGS